MMRMKTPGALGPGRNCFALAASYSTRSISDSWSLVNGVTTA
jgi:hypothetical protein